MKISNPKSQTPKKSQATSWKSCEASIFDLGFGFWSFFGFWFLEFGVF